MCLKPKEFWKKGLLFKLCVIFWIAAFISFILSFFGFKDYTFQFLIEAFSGFVIAAGIMHVALDSKGSKNREQSQYYLEKYIDVCEKILERLQKDAPTRRMAWVTAADMAYSLSDFDTKVTEKADQEYLKVFKRDYAHRLRDFLYGKIPAYFYGVDKEMDLDEALKESQPNFVKMQTDEADCKNPYELRSISERQLFPILQLAEIPDKSRENKQIKDLDELRRNSPRIYLYVNHLKKHKLTRTSETGELKVELKNFIKQEP